MSSWISRKQDYTLVGIPHLTKIIRKPKGVGTEVKCLADGVVGIMLQLEICEGKETEAQRSDRICLLVQLKLSDLVNHGMALEGL